ncbi:MAG: helical backbone metal receptor [Desulfurococcaceae archaeon]
MDNLSKQMCLFMAIFVVLSGLPALAEQQVIDALGRSVTLTAYPRRVVSLAPSITEILASLGVESSVVGADSFSLSSWYMDIGERLKSRGVVEVGGYWWSTISVEKILELNPDLILADRGAHRQLLEAFEAYNLTVVYLGSARSINDVYNDIYTVGLIFNKTGEAENLIRSIESTLQSGKELLKGYEGVKVLIVIDFWQGIWVAGKATFIDDLLARLGLVNAAVTIGWSVVGIEAITEWNPDIVIVACPYASQEAVEQSGLPQLGKPLVLLNTTEVDVLMRPGPLLAYAPQVIYHALVQGLANRTTTTPRTPQQAPLVTSAPLELYVAAPLVALVSGVIGYYVGLRKKR